MTTNTQLSTTEPNPPQKKEQISKQLEQEQNHRNGDHMEDYQWGGEREGKGTENKQHKWQVENRQGEVKNSTGNEDTKELICSLYVLICS